MAQITFILSNGDKKTVDAPIGHSIMEIAVKHDIEAVEGACGGSLACATCHLYVHPDFSQAAMNDNDEKSDDEEDMLDLAFDVRECSRLTCQIEMTQELDGAIFAVPGADVDWAA